MLLFLVAQVILLVSASVGHIYGCLFTFILSQSLLCRRLMDKKLTDKRYMAWSLLGSFYMWHSYLHYANDKTIVETDKPTIDDIWHFANGIIWVCIFQQKGVRTSLSRLPMYNLILLMGFYFKFKYFNVLLYYFGSILQFSFNHKYLMINKKLKKEKFDELESWCFIKKDYLFGLPIDVQILLYLSFVYLLSYPNVAGNILKESNVAGSGLLAEYLVITYFES